MKDMRDIKDIGADKKVALLTRSELYSKIISQEIDRIRGFTLTCVADSETSAENAVRDTDAGLAVVDLDCLGCGAAFVKKLVCKYKIPTVVCTVSQRLAANALSAGAADFVIKTASGGAEEIDGFKKALSNAVQNAANLRDVVSDGKRISLKRRAESCPKNNGLLLFGGSTGSTEALISVLKALPPDCPPTAVSIHMPEGYTSLYAKRLNGELPQEVLEASDGMLMKRGRAIIAKGGSHMTVRAAGGGCYVRVETGERISGHCPSVDVLFDSGAVLAESGIRVGAAILTGMGCDGAKGLLKLREAGAFTVGQDEKTSVVYGMPKAAYDMGAVCVQCGVSEIAPRLLDALGNKNKGE